MEKWHMAIIVLIIMPVQGGKAEQARPGPFPPSLPLRKTRFHTRNDNRVALERALWPPGRSARDPGEHSSLPYMLPLWQPAPGVTWVEEGAVTQVAL